MDVQSFAPYGLRCLLRGYIQQAVGTQFFYVSDMDGLSLYRQQVFFGETMQDAGQGFRSQV